MDNKLPTYSITNCSFTAKAAPASKETAQAMIELARASCKHAEALIEMAKSLKGTTASFGTGITVGCPSE